MSGEGGSVPGPIRSVCQLQTAYTFHYFITHSSRLKIQDADKTVLQLSWCQEEASYALSDK